MTNYRKDLIRFVSVLVFNILFITTNNASVCKSEDFKKYVSSNNGCIGIEQATQKTITNPSKLVVFLHGDHGSKNIGDKLLQAASISGNENTLSFIMARPGWETPSGNVSEGGDPDGPDNGDNYIPERDIDPLAYAITALKNHYKPEHVIVVGFSGGAAITGVIVGRFPNLIDVAVLSACPCIVSPWREHRMQQKREIKPSGKIWWPNSHSPHEYVTAINMNTKIVLVIGINDTNTKLEYSEKYQGMLEKQGIKSELHLISDAGHANLRTNKEYIDLLTKIQKEY